MLRPRSFLLWTTLLLIGSAQPGWSQTFYDLGHFPNGTWAELHAVNDLGVAVGWGNVGADTRMVGVKPYSDASSWFDDGVNSNGMWNLEGMGISNTGIVAGHINVANGEARAYAWVPDDNAGIDLGTLEGDDGSAAMAINNSGTLIVGASYRWINKSRIWARPVVWALERDRDNGRPIERWVIHALPTDGLEQRSAVFQGAILNAWSAFGVNDLGQIVGDAWNRKYDEIAVVWNPLQEGGWALQRLPNLSASSGKTYAATEALSINNRGEVVGEMSADGWATFVPALWTVTPPPKHHHYNLTELGNDFGGIAWGINDIGDVVGVNVDFAGFGLAVRWTTGDPASAISILPGAYGRAMGVNNAGVVVGRFRAGTTGPYQAFAYTIR